MPSPKKTSKWPGRSKARGRSTSATRKSTRSRSRSAGRKPVVETSVEDKTVEETTSRRRPKSPSRTSTRVTTVTKRFVTSDATDSAAFSQEQASVTPIRMTAKISTLIEKEREESARIRDQMKSEMLSSLQTPPPLEKSKPSSKGKRDRPNYEFMGPIGTFFLIFLLPLTVYYINLACNGKDCSILKLPKLPKNIIREFFEVESMLIFLAWFFFQVVLAILPVGSIVEGQPLKSGGQLKYRCNGFFALIVSLLTLAAAIYFKCPVVKVVDKFYKLMTSAVVFSVFLSMCLYISSHFVSPKKLASGGDTGNIIYDFFIGRELNPRIGSLDLKFFCELRPGLIGWVVMNWIMVYKAYLETGTFPANLLLVTVFQTMYVADALWFESAILTTMDITHDGFGFMLVFGDLAWVPFLYGLQPRFLYLTKFVLPWYCLAPIVLLNLVGYGIFRLSNSQKDRFRKDPKDPVFTGMEVLPTQSGKKLLVSGWWGLCRKPNYLGDLIMAFSWSLTTGFGQILTYFYPIYFLVLLIHRERRDFEQCQKKYGASWAKYCNRVPYRIFPNIY